MAHTQELLFGTYAQTDLKVLEVFRSCYLATSNMTCYIRVACMCSWALGLNMHRKRDMTASYYYLLHMTLLEKVFLHSSLGPPLRADPLTLLKALLRQASYYLPFRAARDLTSYAWCTACSLERREN